MAITIMALSLISMTSVQQDVFAQGLGMSITTTTDQGSDTITVTGMGVSDNAVVTFVVKSPNGNVVGIDQVSPDDDGNFTVTFKVGGTWTEDGFYEIAAKQGLNVNSFHTFKFLVEVTDGMTEETSVTISNLDTGGSLSIQTNVVEDAAGLTIYAMAEIGSTTIEITGSTDKLYQDITLTVNAPNGNVVNLAQVSPDDDGGFTSVITTGGPLWKQDGIYTVTAQQFPNTLYTAITEVDIQDGVIVPEFGTIAAMILAVAIISIIAISAKSRLSIIPRY
jgi:predicted secreted protein with PEFG-CTERM motif